MSKQSNHLPSPMELPPVPGNEEYDGKPPEAIKQQGSERNPEFVPPIPASSQPQDDNGSNVSTSAASPSQHNESSQAAPSSAPSAVGNSPAIADDVDLIEKEWVEKAKEIVEKTRENPYLQNKALNEIKADYIKKRYNKELAKSED